MHELAFADAARPTPVVVLKLPLRVYSLGHEAILLQQRNPLLIAGEEQFNSLTANQQIAAIRCAVWICANTWEQNQHEHFVWIKVKFWGWRTRHENIPLAVAEFRNYLASAHAMLAAPEFMDYCAANGVAPDDESPGRFLGSPWLARVVNFMRGGGPVTGLVWNCGFALAAMLYQSHMEAAGSCRIENEQEAEERHERIEGDARAIAEFERELAEKQADIEVGRSEMADGENHPNTTPNSQLQTPIS